MKIEKLIVAYSRPKNLRDLLSPSKLKEFDDCKVQNFLQGNIHQVPQEKIGRSRIDPPQRVTTFCHYLNIKICSQASSLRTYHIITVFQSRARFNTTGNGWRLFFRLILVIISKSKNQIQKIQNYLLMKRNRKHLPHNCFRINLNLVIN